MQIISRVVAGNSGLGAAFAFLVAGAIVVSFALSAGIYLVAKSNGASITATGLLLFGSLVAGVMHSLVSASAVFRASVSRPRSTRVLELLAAGAYCMLQFAALWGAVLLICELGL